MRIEIYLGTIKGLVVCNSLDVIDMKPITRIWLNANQSDIPRGILKQVTRFINEFKINRKFYQIYEPTFILEKLRLQ